MTWVDSVHHIMLHTHSPLICGLFSHLPIMSLRALLVFHVQTSSICSQMPGSHLSVCLLAPRVPPCRFHGSTAMLCVEVIGILLGQSATHTASVPATRLTSISAPTSISVLLLALLQFAELQILGSLLYTSIRILSAICSMSAAISPNLCCSA